MQSEYSYNQKVYKINQVYFSTSNTMQSWECSSCTFRHQAHAPRCVMCHELRISREQMRDFIIGGNKSTGTTSNTSTTNILLPPSSSKSIMKQPPSSSVSSYPLASIENVIPINEISAATNLYNKKHSTTNIPTATGNIPTSTYSTHHLAANAPTMSTVMQRSSIAPVMITRNPYHLKKPLSSGGNVSITMSTTNPHTTSTNNSNPSIIRNASPNLSKSTVPFQSDTTSDPSQSINPSNDNITVVAAVTVARNTVPTTINKRPRTSAVTISSTGKLIPPPSSNNNKKVRKRPKSLTKAIVLPYQPGPVPLAMEYADTWIYPVVDAYPKRQYQYDITTAAIQQNTLVSLPTGLGKTLIAAVVLYNFYRWYPTGKILFLAPTLPLVDQQVQACYEIMGIPAADTALLTGKVPAEQRTNIWQERRVFFCTPQTVQRDLEANRCDALKVVCVVLDEAHKSTGEYAYCKVISHLEQAGAKFRVVGLSATPGTSIKAVQQVINVLRINRVEARSDNDSDVKQYIHDRQTDVVVVKGMDTTNEVENKLNEIIGPLMDILRKRNVILPQFTDHKAISSYTLLKCQSFILKQPQNQRDNAAIGYLSASICFLQIRTDLHKHGIGTVRSKLLKLQTERPRGPLATIVKGETFQALWDEVDKVSCNPNAIDNNLEDKYKNNPKLKKLCEILMDHFEKSKAASTSSRVIVFSQFRTSVSEIVDVLNENKPLIRARHFVGQGKSGAGSGGGTKKVAAKKTSGGEELAHPQQQQHLMDGMKQDEQKDVIQRFKEGMYNTLVCTSIGEEGRKLFLSEKLCVATVTQHFSYYLPIF